MRHIKTYQVFESESSITTLTKEQIIWLNSCAGKLWELNTQTGLVDVYGDFNCNLQGLEGFKGVVFGEVNGSFYCQNNHLTDLVGAPKTVGKNFNCSDNKLTDLEGSPTSVDGYFRCGENQLTNLVGGPEEVTWAYNTTGNPLVSLDGAPDKLEGFLVYVDNLYDTFPTDSIPSWRTPNERDQIFWEEFKLKGLPLLFNSISTGFLNSLIKENPGDFILNIKGVIKNPDCAEKISELNLKEVAKKIGDQLGDVTSLGF